MMMSDVLVQRQTQGCFSEQNEFGKAFLSEGTHPALGEGVQIWTLGRKGQWPYPARSQDIQKGSAELRVAVRKQILLSTEKAGNLVRGITRHLQHPLLGRTPRDARQTDPA